MAVISLDIKGALDAAWWPNILTSLKRLNCPKNLYDLAKNYFTDRSAVLFTNSCEVQREISRGCPQGSCCGPGFLNLQYNSLLKIEYSKQTKVLAFANDVVILTKGKSLLDIEIYANIEIQKIVKWAKNNKINFNDKKSKIMVISRKKARTRRDIRVYLNNKELKQEKTLKYLGLVLDDRFKFNEHVEYITSKCIKIIHAL